MEFSFNGKSTSKDGKIFNRMNNYGMTGCLNFYKVKFNNNNLIFKMVNVKIFKYCKFSLVKSKKLILLQHFLMH